MEEMPRFIPFEPIEHTADLAFVARGRTPEELFTHAAEAMIAFLYDRATVQPREEERLEVSGEDFEELLVSWLQEILYRLEAQQRLYHEFLIESAVPPRLAARATGERYDPARHARVGNVKAATYHDLAVRHGSDATGSLWWVQVVLDT